MTDSLYHLNLIHLIYCAFDVFARRGGTLEGGWYGDLGDQYCFEIIGDAIESELPPRIQQILKSSLYHLLNVNRAAPRAVDPSSAIFKCHKPSWAATELHLGVNSYYDDIKQSPGPGYVHGPRAYPRRCFKIYYNNYISRLELRYARDSKRSHRVYD